VQVYQKYIINGLRDFS